MAQCERSLGTPLRCSAVMPFRSRAMSQEAYLDMVVTCSICSCACLVRDMHTYDPKCLASLCMDCAEGESNATDDDDAPTLSFGDANDSDVVDDGVLFFGHGGAEVNDEVCLHIDQRGEVVRDSVCSQVDQGGGK